MFNKYKFETAINLSKKTHTNRNSAWKISALNNKPVLYNENIKDEYSYL